MEDLIGRSGGLETPPRDHVELERDPEGRGQLRDAPGSDASFEELHDLLDRERIPGLRADRDPGGHQEDREDAKKPYLRKRDEHGALVASPGFGSLHARST